MDPVLLAQINEICREVESQESPDEFLALICMIHKRFLRTKADMAELLDRAP